MPGPSERVCHHFLPRCVHELLHWDEFFQGRSPTPTHNNTWAPLPDGGHQAQVEARGVPNTFSLPRHYQRTRLKQQIRFCCTRKEL